MGRRRPATGILHVLTIGVQVPRNAVPRLHGHPRFRFHDLDVAERQVGVGQTQYFVDLLSRLVDGLRVVVKDQAAVGAIQIFDDGVARSGDLRSWDMVGSSLLTLLLVSSHRSDLAAFLVFLLA